MEGVPTDSLELVLSLVYKNDSAEEFPEFNFYCWFDGSSFKDFSIVFPAS